jgi:anti-sigma factor RsiW
MEEHETSRLSAWIDGELSTEQAASVERHLAECASCVELVGELRQLQESLRLTARAEPDPSFVSRFRDRRDALSVAPWWTWRQLALRLAPLAIVVLLAAIATALLAPVELGGLPELEREALGDASVLGAPTLPAQEPVLRIALEPFPGELP